MPAAPQSRVLLVAAAPAEAGAVLAGLGQSGQAQLWQPTAAGSFDVLLSGVSKANAAGAMARFADPTTHAAVLSVGVAGALPDCGLSIGDIVIGSQAIFADEGVQTPGRFHDCSEMGFPLVGSGVAVPVAHSLMEWLQTALSSAQLRTGAIATVSTCAGTDALAKTVRDRTGAIAEGMEGAAVGLVGHRLGIPFGEVRIISNTTGDRNRQVWDLQKALQGLSRVIHMLAAVRSYQG
jgi:futalosine hydrolase